MFDLQLYTPNTTYPPRKGENRNVGDIYNFKTEMKILRWHEQRQRQVKYHVTCNIYLH